MAEFYKASTFRDYTKGSKRKEQDVTDNEQKFVDHQQHHEWPRIAKNISKMDVVKIQDIASVVDEQAGILIRKSHNQPVPWVLLNIIQATTSARSISFQEIS